MKECYVVFWINQDGDKNIFTVAKTEELAKEIIEIETDPDLDLNQDHCPVTFGYEKVSFTSELD